MRRLAVAAAFAAALAVPVANAGSASKAGPLDEHWLKASIQGDIFEVTGGKLAMQTGQTAAVRALGQRLVTDHSKSLMESRRLAASLGIASPTRATPAQQWELQVLRSQQSLGFDRWYASLEVRDHVMDISEAQEEVRNGTTPSVKASAAKEIPTLKMHLTLARRAVKAAGSKSALKH